VTLYQGMPNQALEQTRDSVMGYGGSVGCELLSLSVQQIGVRIMSETETKDLKAAVLELVDDLPSDATWEDVMYRVYVREAIEAGRKDAAEGRLVDLAEVRRRFGLPE
jgi:hypothetical protein